MIGSQNFIGFVHTKVNTSSIHQSFSKMFLEKTTNHLLIKLFISLMEEEPLIPLKKTTRPEAFRYLEEFRNL